MSRKHMNILIAPNSMKGSLSAFDFADIVEEAFLKVSESFQVRKVPVADGGDYTGEVLARAMNAGFVDAVVSDPLGRSVKTRFAVSGKLAVIEMADASGMKFLRPDELNPMRTSSAGTGQLISKAMELGCTEIWLGAGGSATVDGGAGMLEGMGFRLLDKHKNSLPANGMNTGAVRFIEKPAHLPKVSFKIITDVDNPLLGETGAATVFGPQKGADANMVRELEANLKAWNDLLERESQRQLSGLKGAGAAGGLALPLIAFFDTQLVAGAGFVLSALRFEAHAAWADLVITGEGKIDSQTLHNKAPKVVADFARKAGKTVIAIGAATEPEASHIFTGGAFSFLPGPVSTDDSVKHTKKNLSHFSYQLAKLIFSSMEK